MVCIYCHSETQVNNSRAQLKSNSVWRRRKCLQCQAIFSTTESPNYSDNFIVVKKSGKTEPFYREKIFISIYKSLDHLKNSQTKANALADTVMANLFNKGNLSSPKINSLNIAQEVTKVLKRFNAAGAIKYQSYQKHLSSAKDIRKTLTD